VNQSESDEDIAVEDFEMNWGDVDVSEIPIYHDAKKKYSPLETFITIVDDGMAFGELAMKNPGNSDNVRIYSSVAVCDTLLVTISK
jgi:hypothetical protein